MTRCGYITGPCVDGTQAGRRCSAEAAPGADRCAQHGGRTATYVHDGGRSLCAEHAGYELAHAIHHAPERGEHELPGGTWQLITPDMVRALGLNGRDVACETCGAHP